MAELAEYVRVLADQIGPRPASTEEEHQAALFIAQEFSDAGLEVDVNEFAVPTGTRWPLALGLILAFAGALVTGLGFAASSVTTAATVVGLVLSVVGLVIFFAEYRGRHFLSSRRLSGVSQNVVARHVPAGVAREKRRRKIVIVSHVDTVRARPEDAPVFACHAGLLRTLVCVCAIASLVCMFVRAIPIPWPDSAAAGVSFGLWIASLVFAVVIIAAAAMIVAGRFSAYVCGANDNASGNAVMLGVAKRLLDPEERKRHARKRRASHGDFFADEDVSPDGRDGAGAVVRDGAVAAAAGVAGTAGEVAGIGAAPAAEGSPEGAFGVASEAPDASDALEGTEGTASSDATVVIHGPAAARAAGVVADGAELVYDDALAAAPADVAAGDVVSAAAAGTVAAGAAPADAAALQGVAGGTDLSDAAAEGEPRITPVPPEPVEEEPAPQLSAWERRVRAAEGAGDEADSEDEDDDETPLWEALRGRSTAVADSSADAGGTPAVPTWYQTAKQHAVAADDEELQAQRSRFADVPLSGPLVREDEGADDADDDSFHAAANAAVDDLAALAATDVADIADVVGDASASSAQAAGSAEDAAGADDAGSVGDDGADDDVAVAADAVGVAFDEPLQPVETLDDDDAVKAALSGMLAVDIITGDSGDADDTADAAGDDAEASQIGALLDMSLDADEGEPLTDAIAEGTGLATGRDASISGDGATDGQKPAGGILASLSTRFAAVGSGSSDAEAQKPPRRKPTARHVPDDFTPTRAEDPLASGTIGILGQDAAVSSSYEHTEQADPFAPRSDAPAAPVAPASPSPGASASMPAVSPRSTTSFPTLTGTHPALSSAMPTVSADEFAVAPAPASEGASAAEVGSVAADEVADSFVGEFGQAAEIKMPESRLHDALDKVGSIFSRPAGDDAASDDASSGRARKFGRGKGRAPRDEDPWDTGDDVGWKGGGYLDASESAFEAARKRASEIRDSVVSMSESDLLDKEVWFVALGASAVNNFGMRNFIELHASDLRGALIVNVECVGAGELTYIESEGRAKTRPSDRRLQSLVRSASRESFGRPLASAPMNWRDTDATPALDEGLRAMTIMGLEGGVPVQWHAAGDTSDIVSEKNLEQAVDLIVGIVEGA